MRVLIFTDGGADPNPGVGGWAAILRAGGREKILTGNELQTTNNRMELQAAIAALQALTRPSEVELHTDSEYLKRGITEWIKNWEANGWERKGKPIPNVDLWEKLWALVKIHDVDWHWVRGHSGNRTNERVDALARRARQEITPDQGDFQDAPKLFVRSSCKGNPGPGGWGVILERGDDTEQLSGSDFRTTNNRMELTAVIEGLGMVSDEGAAQVITTSDYVFQGATRWIHGWRKREWKKRDGKPVSNQILWRELDRLMSEIHIQWVNAKGEEYEKERGLVEASLLAVSAAKMND